MMTFGPFAHSLFFINQAHRLGKGRLLIEDVFFHGANWIETKKKVSFSRTFLVIFHDPSSVTAYFRWRKEETILSRDEATSWEGLSVCPSVGLLVRPFVTVSLFGLLGATFGRVSGLVLISLPLPSQPLQQTHSRLADNKEREWFSGFSGRSLN